MVFLLVRHLAAPTPADEQQMHDEADSGQHAPPDGPRDVVSAAMCDHGGCGGCENFGGRDWFD